jgi:HEAT repeat protein
MAEIVRVQEHPSWWAFETLGRIGPSASNALPVLLDALHSESKARFAVRSLRNLRAVAAPAIPDLSRMILSRQAGYPIAVEALLNIGPPARETLPVLEPLLVHTNLIVRALAAAALAKIGGLHDMAVPVLIQVLETTNRVRDSWSPPFSYSRGPSVGFSPPLTAAWFLGEIGSPATAAVPSLKQAMRSRNTWLRAVAARALWRINGEADPVLPALAGALQVTKSSQTEAIIAAMTLAEMGPAARAALPELQEARLHGNKNLRREAVRTLARVREVPGVPLTPRASVTNLNSGQSLPAPRSP